jgi:N-acetylmuramoyl-L-alanine amidase
MESPRRPRLIPLWAIIVPAAFALVGIGIIVALVWSRASSLVSVPAVTGLDLASARTRIEAQGLRMQRGDRRFSPTVPVDGVIEQSPVAGTKVPRGTAVVLVVSAGTEAFTLPDVIGLKVGVARQALESRGLVVQTEVVPSNRETDTVVAQSPAAGVTVSSSDVVQLSISSGGQVANGLQPVDLTGRVFVIDPAMSIAATDTAMEVQRRINSLLAASGARVIVTRGVAGADVAPDARAKVTRESSATAVIGLSLASTGTPGLRIQRLAASQLSAAAYLASTRLATALQSKLTGLEPGTAISEIIGDPVLAAAQAGVRVSLGSIADPQDVAHFADPAWEDSVAGAVYSAIGGIYGTPLRPSSAATSTPATSTPATITR